MKTLSVIVLSLLCITGKGFGQSTILWSEALNGSFSHDSSAPSLLAPMQVGTNSIIGATEVEPTGPSWSALPDFFRIQVPSGFKVTVLGLDLNKPNVWTWLGEPDFINELAFSFSPASGDLLPQWGQQCIGPGTYGMYMENHDLQSFTSIANYRLDFVVIPEPALFWLLLGGLGWLAVCRRRGGT